jgi:hypothetical protein
VTRGLLFLLLEPLTLPFVLREWPFCMSGIVIIFRKGAGRGEENAGAD